MKRMEFGRTIAEAILALIASVLLVGAVASGVGTVNAWLKDVTEGPAAKLIGFVVLMGVGAYYLVLTTTGDPFWPARKRLWRRGEIWLAAGDQEDHAEPFIWSKKAIPAGNDVSELFD